MPVADTRLDLNVLESSGYVQRMRMFLSLRHGMVQCFLRGDGISVLPVELAARPVDVERPLGLNVLVRLDGAGLRPPRELLRLLRCNVSVLCGPGVHGVVSP